MPGDPRIATPSVGASYIAGKSSARPRGDHWKNELHFGPSSSSVSFVKHGLIPLSSSSVQSDPSLQCPHCPYYATRRASLVNHLRIHTGEKPFACTFCPHRFAQKVNLKAHIRTHTGEKIYGCPHCEYRATRKGTLLKHMASHSTP